MNRRLLIAALATSALLFGACGGDDDEAAKADPSTTESGAAANEVTISTFNFAPDPITVKAGTTITFRNMDKINHSVTSGTREEPTPDVFDEGVMDSAGSTFELTLDEPGTYAYFCRFHPGQGMTGEIVVE